MATGASYSRRTQGSIMTPIFLKALWDKLVKATLWLNFIRNLISGGLENHNLCLSVWIFFILKISENNVYFSHATGELRKSVRMRYVRALKSANANVNC